MASRLILKDLKAPIHLLLRNRASSAPLLAQTIQNHLVPISAQSAAQSSKFEIVFDRMPLSMDLLSKFDGGFKIEVRGKQWEKDRFEDEDEMEKSGSDFEDSDELTGDFDDESGGDFDDDEDGEPRDDEV